MRRAFVQGVVAKKSDIWEVLLQWSKIHLEAGYVGKKIKQTYSFFVFLSSS